MGGGGGGSMVECEPVASSSCGSSGSTMDIGIRWSCAGCGRCIGGNKTKGGKGTNKGAFMVHLRSCARYCKLSNEEKVRCVCCGFVGCGVTPPPPARPCTCRRVLATVAVQILTILSIIIIISQRQYYCCTAPTLHVVLHVACLCMPLA
jgi:hypothetical protein